MKKPRILHFELDKNLGGIETFLLNLYNQIDRNKIQFEFITAVKRPALEQQFLKLGGVIHHVSAHKNVICYCRDVKSILESGIDVVHIHKNSAANIIPVILAKKCKIRKIIVHSHNTAPSTGKISVLLHKINKPYLNRMADVRLACSIEAGKWLFGKEQFEIMTNGVLTDKFCYNESVRKNKRQELNIDKSTLVIGSIGRFVKQKNQLRAVDIFAEFTKIQSNAVLLFVGEGELRPQIEKYTKEKNLTEKIKFLGIRYDIPELLMAMDCFLMPSLHEGLPIVAVEAQAAGLPLILADTVSSETELTSAVRWFSLNQTDADIAQLIYEIAYNNNIDRHMLLGQVIQGGFDIKKTANSVLTYYIE